MAPGVEAPEAITRQTGFHASFIASKLCSDCSAGRSLCQTGQPWKSNRGRQRIGPVPAPPVPAPPVVVPGASGVDRKGPRQVRPLIQQGIISHFFDALCFPEWKPSTNRVTYRLYRCPEQEHITRIERIPDSAARRRGRSLSSLAPWPAQGAPCRSSISRGFSVMSTRAFRRASPPRSAWKSWSAARRSPSSSAGRHGERTLGPSGRVSRSPSSTTTRRVPSGRSTGATATSAGTHTIGSALCPTSTHCLPRSMRIRRRSSGVGGLGAVSHVSRSPDIRHCSRGAASCGRPGRPSGPA
jgi:hypothetical protein